MKVSQLITAVCVSSLLIFTGKCLVKCDDQETDDRPSEGQPDSSALVFVKDVEEEGHVADVTDGHVTVENDDGDLHESSDIQELFVATNEWQEVKKGQRIPPGLYVSMDFQTGKQWAKLLTETTSQGQDNPGKAKQRVSAARSEHWWKKSRKDRINRGKENRMKSWDAGEKIGIINTEKKRFSRDELKKALKDFKYKDDVTSKEDDLVKSKFRSYDELKKVVRDSKMSVKTEIEIVTELYTKLLSRNQAGADIVPILTDLEYYLHQIDNARVFADLGGLTILKHLLNSTEDETRAGAAHVLGAAVQSNAKVQVAALDSGLMQQLVTSLSVDASLKVRKKCLFALSALVRQFPFAQKRLLDAGGLSALAGLFRAATDEALKLKILTLLTDLLVEYDLNVEGSEVSDSVQAQRSQQYKTMSLRGAMSSSGWCPLMTSLLNSLSGHDSVEKLISAMSALSSTCRQAFHPAHTQLRELMVQYGELAREEREEDGGDDFFLTIYSSIERLVSQIGRDEL